MTTFQPSTRPVSLWDRARFAFRRLQRRITDWRREMRIAQLRRDAEDQYSLGNLEAEAEVWAELGKEVLARSPEQRQRMLEKRR